MSTLGVIQAGGRNTRFGAHKALVEVGGIRIIDRVRHALEGAVADVVLVANEPGIYGVLGLPMRPDARPDAGALGGILTALYWARDHGDGTALVVACDMPFVPPELLRLLVESAAGSARPSSPGDRLRTDGAAAATYPPGAPTLPGTAAGPDVVAPASGGRRGLEPLCACYATTCIGPIERALDRGDRRVVSFFDDVRTATIPLDRVRRYGDPAVLFMNVNTPEELERAERLATGASGVPVPSSSDGRLREGSSS